jgi:hypothetical protein
MDNWISIGEASKMALEKAARAYESRVERDQRLWIEAAELALAGDTSKLRIKVDLAKAERNWGITERGAE